MEKGAKKVQLTYADLCKLVGDCELVREGVTIALPKQTAEDDLSSINEIINILDQRREDLEDEVIDDLPDSDDDDY